MLKFEDPERKDFAFLQREGKGTFLGTFAAANPAFRARLGKETHRKQMELHTWRERRLIA